jgi:glycosyltransferase involved in cell wall biosynthesis
MLLRERPDVVHIHTAPYWVFWETIFYVLACKLAKISCALQMHFSFRYFYNDSAFLLRKLMIWGIRLTSFFVLICKDDIKCLKDVGAEDIATFYLPNCVDVRKIRTGVRENFSDAEKNILEILFFGGSDTIRKGLPELLSTIPYLSKRFSNVYFRLVAVSESSVKETVPEIYQNRCIVEGWISGHAKYECLACADIFALPTHAEGMPISILEAMAAGLPIVASNVAGIPDTIRNGQEGILVPSGDVLALAEALRILLISKSLRVKMGMNALKRVAKEFDLAVGISNFRDLYNLTIIKKNLNCHKSTTLIKKN